MIDQWSLVWPLGPNTYLWQVDPSQQNSKDTCPTRRGDTTNQRSQQAWRRRHGSPDPTKGFFCLSKTAWIRRGFHPADQHFGPINPDGPMFSVEYVEYPALRFISPTGPNLPKNDMNSLPSDTHPPRSTNQGLSHLDRYQVWFMSSCFTSRWHRLRSQKEPKILAVKCNFMQKCAAKWIIHHCAGHLFSLVQHLFPRQSFATSRLLYPKRRARNRRGRCQTWLESPRWAWCFSQPETSTSGGGVPAMFDFRRVYVDMYTTIVKEPKNPNLRRLSPCLYTLITQLQCIV